MLAEKFAPDVVEQLHRTKLARIAAQLKEHDAGMPVSLRKESPPHQVPKSGDLRRATTRSTSAT